MKGLRQCTVLLGVIDQVSLEKTWFMKGLRPWVAHSWLHLLPLEKTWFMKGLRLSFSPSCILLSNVHPFCLPCIYWSSDTWDFKRFVALCPNFPIFSSYIRFLECSGGGFWSGHPGYFKDSVQAKFWHPHIWYIGLFQPWVFIQLYEPKASSPIILPDSTF